MDFETQVGFWRPMIPAVQAAQIASLPLSKTTIEKILAAKPGKPVSMGRLQLQMLFGSLCSIEYQTEYIQFLQPHPEFSLLVPIPTSILDVFEVHWKNGVGTTHGGAPYAKLLEKVFHLRRQSHTYADWTTLIKASFEKHTFPAELYKYACRVLLAIHVGDSSNSWELFWKGLALSLYFSQTTFPESDSTPSEFTRLCLARVCMHVNTLLQPHWLRLEQMWYQLCLYTGCEGSKWKYSSHLSWNRMVA